MNVQDFDHLSDAQIAQYFRAASLERAECGFNWVLGNRIVNRKMTPAYKALEARGQHAVRELLALADDLSPNVRADAAAYAYAADPVRCRDVLRKLVGERGLPAAIATVWLIDKDPDFRREFGEMGQLGPEHFLQEFGRRYPPANET